MVLTSMCNIKLMIVSRQPYDNVVLYINDQPIERTNKFKYLVSTFKQDSDGEVEIRAVTVKAFVRFDKYLVRCL